MKHFLSFLAVALSTASANAQLRPVQPVVPLHETFNTSPSPPYARYGADGYAAYQRCSPQMAERLNTVMASGELDWLPSPLAALKIIAKLGPTAAQFVMDNARILRDQDAFEAFVDDPESFIYGRKSLAEDAATRRERRQGGWSIRADRSSFLALGIGLATGLIGGFLIHRRIRRPP